MTIADMWLTSSWILVKGTTVFTRTPLARQKMVLFMFTLAVTENFSAPFVSSCISCSHWMLRILYLGTSQPGSRHKSSLTNTTRINARYGLCTVAYLVG
jgi:hypothetical protein